MISWFLRRLGQILPTLLILSFGIFALQQLMPGDPALILAGEERGDPAVLAQIRAELMLDRPLLEQYGHWLWRLLHGDFGFSWRIRVPVGELLLDKLPVTAQLASMSFVIGVAIGVPAGVISAVAKDKPLDWLMNAVALFGISMPNFWLGIMMILLFSVQLGWLPPSGYVPLWEDPWQSLATTIMPAFVLGTGVASVLMRHTRAAMLGALEQDYIRTARAKGVVERSVIARHALRNALIPVVTLGTIEFGRLLAGAVLTEQIFSIPGFGKLVVDAVFNRDYPVVQGVVLATALIFVALSLVADILYMLINPRLRAA
ncbi:ABC transporter permease [Rhodovarius sp.]|jgi:peptide/nickel transport system permease protein|uniref:ABC transporter permease n=1 Tax=Rhodovarius sp. TaxID=2972673 RepID=UPI003340849E